MNADDHNDGKFHAVLQVDAGPPNVSNTYPEIYKSWATMSQALMNGPSPLREGERELILAYAAGDLGEERAGAYHARVPEPAPQFRDK